MYLQWRPLHWMDTPQRTKLTFACGNGFDRCGQQVEGHISSIGGGMQCTGGVSVFVPRIAVCIG